MLVRLRRSAQSPIVPQPCCGGGELRQKRIDVPAQRWVQPWHWSVNEIQWMADLFREIPRGRKANAAGDQSKRSCRVRLKQQKIRLPHLTEASAALPRRFNGCKFGMLFGRNRSPFAGKRNAFVQQGTTFGQ